MAKTLAEQLRSFLGLDTSPANPANPSQSTLPDLSSFLYLSDSNIDTLEQQVVASPETIAPKANRYQALSNVLEDLRNKSLIGGFQSDKPYISGTCSLKWGVVNWGENLAVSFFFTESTNPMLLMIGSLNHIVSESWPVGYSFTNSSSGSGTLALPNMMRAIRSSLDTRTQRWSEKVGGTNDYLFALGFIKDKFIYESRIQEIKANFPDRTVRFAARLLKRLPAPNDTEAGSILTNPKLDTFDKQK